MHTKTFKCMHPEDSMDITPTLRDSMLPTGYINAHTSRDRGDHKGKRPKFVMSPRAQRLVSTTHHGCKPMLRTCTHDMMIEEKAANPINSGARPRKRRFFMSQFTQLYLSPLSKTIEVGAPTLAPQMPHHGSHSNDNGVFCNDHYRQRTK